MKQKPGGSYTQWYIEKEKVGEPMYRLLLKWNAEIEHLNRNIENAGSYETALWTERTRDKCQQMLNELAEIVAK